MTCIYIYIYVCVCVCVCVCLCSCWSLLYPLFEWLQEITYLIAALAHFTTWNRRLKRHDEICVLACSGISFVVIKSTNSFQELADFSSRRSVSTQEQFSCHFFWTQSLTQIFLPVLRGFPRHCQPVEAQCAKRSARNKPLACDVIHI